jgi:hypothetical protein
MKGAIVIAVCFAAFTVIVTYAVRLRVNSRTRDDGKEINWQKEKNHLHKQILRQMMLDSDLFIKEKVDEFLKKTEHKGTSVFKGRDEEFKSYFVNSKSATRKLYNGIWTDASHKACQIIEKKQRTELGIEYVIPMFSEAIRCEASRSLKARYRLDDAPKFPLADCKRGKAPCVCWYKSVIPALDKNGKYPK